MFTKKETWLDQEIARTDRRLKNETFGTEEYVKVFQFRLQLQELKNGNSKPLSKETLVLAATNLLGIILIIKHENVNVISSKAMSLLMKAR
jgi:hypothetical protein